jgi:EmrB/QacA subfamily drug resistance transporter
VTAVSVVRESEGNKRAQDLLVVRVAVTMRSPIRYGTPSGRWVIFATVLGSGIAFLDSTVVNVAIPAIDGDFHPHVASLQWTIEAYLLTLGSLVLLGGSLGDLYGRRRMFVLGLGGFTLASAISGLAPSIELLIAARALQGIAAAILVPSSLAILQTSFHTDDRGRAIGAWSGLSGVTTATGPFIGGWLIDVTSWRTIFFLNVPLALAAILISMNHVSDSRDENARRPDLLGSVAVISGLGGVVYALVEGPAKGWGGAAVVMSALVGASALIAFVVIERRVSEPLLPLEIFASSQFSGANAITLLVYFALGGALFLVVIQLQRVLGYSALEAGTALLPITLLLLFMSPRTGAFARRIGPRLPLTVGPLIAACGLALMARIGAGATYFGAVFPAMIVFRLGMGLLVAPLTSAVLAAVETRHAGVGSGVNNAVARIAALLAVALLPFAAGISGTRGLVPQTFAAGFPKAVLLAAGVCALGAVASLMSIRRPHPVALALPPSVDHPCYSAEAPIRASAASAS